MLQRSHLTEEILELQREHEKRFGRVVNFMYAPDDPVIVAKRIRKALEEGVPWDTEKEFDDWLEKRAPEWFRKEYKEGKIIIY